MQGVVDVSVLKCEKQPEKVGDVQFDVSRQNFKTVINPEPTIHARACPGRSRMRCSRTGHFSAMHSSLGLELRNITRQKVGRTKNLVSERTLAGADSIVVRGGSVLPVCRMR